MKGLRIGMGGNRQIAKEKGAGMYTTIIASLFFPSLGKRVVKIYSSKKGKAATSSAREWILKNMVECMIIHLAVDKKVSRENITEFYPFFCDKE